MLLEFLVLRDVMSCQKVFLSVFGMGPVDGTGNHWQIYTQQGQTEWMVGILVWVKLVDRWNGRGSFRASPSVCTVVSINSFALQQTSRELITH